VSTSPRPPDHHLVFSHIVDGFLRGVLGERLTPPLKEKIKRVGIDLSKPLDPAYKVAVFEDALELVALELYPALTRTEALIEVGRLQLTAFSESTLGRASMPLFKLYAKDHERLLKVVSRGFRQGNNYVETKHEKLGEGHHRLWMNDAGRLPEIFQGMLEACTGAMGLESEVRIAEQKGLEVWYELRAK
jgi:uncharacterized protein (TIGR02265 family)